MPYLRSTNHAIAFTVLLSFAWLLTGCQKGTESLPVPSENAHEQHDNVTEVAHHDHGSEHDHDSHQNMAMSTYECEPKQTIEAHYAAATRQTLPALSADNEDSTYLLIDGIQYDLMSISGLTDSATSNPIAVMRYETEYGIDDDAGLI